jgi:galactitol PTS system EIIC component
MDTIFQPIINVFTWLFAQGAPIIVPVTVIIIGLLFRAPWRRILFSALRMGVGFTALYALIGIVFQSLGPPTAMMAERFGIQLTVTDVGWPVHSGIVFSLPWAMTAIALFFLFNAVIVAIGLVKTLNVDFFNHWAYIFIIGAVQIATGSWILAIASGVLYWFITLKMADWTYPYLNKYYELPIEGISIPHTYSVMFAPFGFLLDKIWDKVPVIKNIRIDPTLIREKYGLLGEPIVIGFFVGLIVGSLAWLSFPPTGTEISLILSLALTLAFFMLLLPRAAELIVMGMAPLSESIREWIVKRMPGREFYLGLDVAIVVGAPEHVALGVLLVPVCFLLAVIVPGNTMLPLADAAGFMIFFTVFAVNTNRGNLFRGLLNSIILWIPVALLIGGAFSSVNMEMVAKTGFELPEGVFQIGSITSGSYLVGFAFYEISRFITAVGTGTGFVTAILILAVFGGVWYMMRNRPKEYAKELELEKEGELDTEIAEAPEV